MAPRADIKKNNKIITNMENKNYISLNIAKKLKIHNAITPRMYGLPKLHETESPVRPIV